MKRNILLILRLLSIVLLCTAVSASETLDPARQELPAAQNAYTFWLEAIPELKLPDDQVLRDAFDLAQDYTKNMPKGEARQKLDAWLASKQASLVQISQGIALGQLQFPTCTDETFMKVDLSGLRHIARMKYVLGREYAERADYVTASREFMEIIRMGRLVSAGDGPIVYYLTGYAIQSMGLGGLRWLIAKDEIPPALLQQIQRDLPVPQAADPVLAQVFRVEYTQFMVPQIRKFEKDAAALSNNFPIRISKVLDVNDTIAIAKTFYTHLVTDALTPWPAHDRQIAADANALVPREGNTDIGDFYWNLLWGASKWTDKNTEKVWNDLKKLSEKQPNVFGKIMVAANVVNSPLARNHSVSMNTSLSLTRILVALQQFRNETGTWPESLDDPSFKTLLPDSPVDFFTGKSVLYSREKGLVWSVGPDGTDDGGDSKKDIVIKLPNPRSEDTNHKPAEPQQ